MTIKSAYVAVVLAPVPTTKKKKKKKKKMLKMCIPNVFFCTKVCNAG